MTSRSLGLLLFLVVLTGGCGDPAPDDGPRTVTDALDRTVALDPPVQRVVSLAPNLTEIAHAAGAGDRLVAITSSGDHPPSVDTLPHVSALPVDFEAVAAQEPDLVLATDQINAPGDTDTFEALNVPIYFFSFGSVGDILTSIETMGQLLGTEAAAADSAAALQSSLDALRARTGSLPDAERPRVLVLVGDDTLYSFGRGSYVHTLVRAAGGTSITADIENQAPTLSDEYVLQEKPDVILGLWGRDYDPDRLLDLHPTWDVVPAVQNDRVLSLPTSLIARPGPRVLQGARRLARYLHPDRVSAPSDSTGRLSSSMSSPAAP
ncbi:ABC-type Fe3+-hydroxamate transport system substrate-binding protein [Salinibacter ruber]|nr:helical backbone metal receptor [Salinibacter ruber]MBB4060703.1 ABC-type Fe3+-hydroxamate transport system substrate-binding protein [Salinibacter ruber]MBB4068741.1 ABC-type Fe3+-hydroxamate transport system substrate-binding protein [Salinibacter ruber]MCS3636825.1 ABC-type Fe3+-hydroxamate transport system substrate-binding protein [Salinibacter ruber]MCS3671509.1 ABC-type Fe3+-hydroxamate transport system substrate-binding protein [Salinibacter ruber]MCS3707848.1 ABC-type Fe3+-hydroxam